MKTLKIYPAIFLFFSLAFLIYFPAIQGDFIWDDDLHLTENKQLESEEGLKNIWFKPGATFQYFPLTFTSFWLERRLWGDNPTGYHVINLLLHTSSALLLWRILILLSVPGAGLAALIFLMHPVNVESVAWITERKNTLSGLFYMGSLTFYLRFLQLESPPLISKKKASQKINGLFYVFSIISFLLAILSKAATCTLPAVILLIIWWKKDSIKLKDILWVTPFLLLALLMARLIIIVEKISAGAKGIEWDLSFWERFIIAGKSLWFYLYSLIYPLNIAFAYPKWSVDSAVVGHYLPSLAFLALIAGLGLFRNKVGKAPLVAILFFAGTLFPALGFFNIYYMRYSFASDHFQYLACIGPIALFSTFLTILATSVSRSSSAVKVPPYFLPVFSASLLLVLGLLTWKQTHIYKNNEILWRDTLSKNPDSGRAHHNLGLELENQGKLQQAFEHWKKAVALNPNFTEVHYNLGRAYHQNGELPLAVSEFKRSLELDPAFYPNFNTLARVLAEQGNLKAALNYAQKGVRMKPNYSPGVITFGNILEESGKLREAEAVYRKVLELDSNFFESYLNLANILYRLGNLTEAAIHYRKTIALNPDSVEAQYNLGNIFGRQGQLEEAEKAFKKAIILDGKLPLAHYGLGIIYQRFGQYSKAIEAFKQALSLNPKLEQAHYFLAEIYDEMGQGQKAISHIRLAEKVSGQNRNRVLQNKARTKLNALSEKYSIAPTQDEG
jgi:protein O-mannosyl-transferase